MLAKKATNAEIMKQVIYEMLTLAYCIELMMKNKPTKGQSHIDSSEVTQITAAIKIRLLYDFLYGKKANEKSGVEADGYTALDDFGKKVPKPSLVGCCTRGMFTKESILKYVVFLTKERILKSKELPEPKFKGGAKTAMVNSAMILCSAEKFIDDQVKESFMNLNQESENYLYDFKHAIARLKEIPEFKANYK